MDRRKMMMILVGGAAGVAASPMPWKLIDDISIWTQSSSWATRLPRGPVTERFGHCPLCPAGCGIRVRAVARIPFAISPVPDHPLSDGRLCALGLCGHHLPVHPELLTSARVRDLGGDRPRDIPSRLGAMRLSEWISDQRRSGGVVAILDTRPGTVDSAIHRWCLEGLPGGVYVPLHGEAAPLDLAARGLGETRPSLHFDLTESAALLGLGGDPSDGWGSAAATARGVGSNTLLVTTGAAKLPTPSGHALRIRSGTEADLAIGIARELIRLGKPPWLADMGDALRSLPDADRIAARCGVPAAAISSISQLVADGRVAPIPLDALCSRGSERSLRAVTGLALLLATPSGSGGILPGGDARGRWPADVAGAGIPDTPLDEIEDGSIDLLIIDDRYSRHLPDHVQLRRLLRDPFRSRLVRVSAFRCDDDPSWDLLLPAPGYHERVDEVLAPVDQPRSAYALSTPILEPGPCSVEPASPLLLAFSSARPERAHGAARPERSKLIAARIDHIFRSGEGSVHSPRAMEEGPRPVSSLASAADLARSLRAGAVWIGAAPERIDTTDRKALGMRLLAEAGGAPPAESPPISRGPRHLTAIPDLPPVMGKLYSESDLERRPGT